MGHISNTLYLKNTLIEEWENCEMEINFDNSGDNDVEGGSDKSGAEAADEEEDLNLDQDSSRQTYEDIVWCVLELLAWQAST
jgi:hypothetical protein